MKKKALAKEFFMSIKKTYNRFISICLIVMLGTAFFAGVKAAEPDMQESADIFFDDSKLMDIRVLSTLGLTEDDVTAISAIEGVESAIPVYTYDVLTEKDEKQHVIKLMSETTDINKITVTEGQNIHFLKPVHGVTPPIPVLFPAAAVSSAVPPWQIGRAHV